VRPPNSRGVLLLIPFAAVVSLALSGAFVDHAYALEKKFAGDVVVGEYEVEPEVRTGGGSIVVLGAVEGDVSSGFGSIKVYGPVGGDVEAGSGDVLVDAPVGGDVHLGAGYLRLGPNARIKGQVTVASGRFSAHSEAEYPSGVSTADMFGGMDEDGPSGVFAGFLGRVLIALLLAAAAILAAVLSPRSLRTTSANLDASLGRALLVGLGSVPAVLLASVALGITGVGLLLLPLLLPAYLFLALFGLLAAAYWVGRRVLLATGRYRAGDAVAAAVGAAIVAVVSLVPFVGVLLVALLALTGTGAAMLAILAHKRGSRATLAQRSL